jgi:hypothetical protein
LARVVATENARVDRLDAEQPPDLVLDAALAALPRAFPARSEGRSA